MQIPIKVIDTPTEVIEVTPIWTIFNEPPLGDLNSYLNYNN